MEFTNNDYFSEREICKNELLRYLDLEINTIELILDQPIYPNNEELYNEFVDEMGFDETEFILYLIRLNDLNTEFDDYGNTRIVKAI